MKNNKITESRTSDTIPLIQQKIIKSTQKKFFSKYTSTPIKLNSENALISMKKFPKYIF